MSCFLELHLGQAKMGGGLGSVGAWPELELMYWRFEADRECFFFPFFLSFFLLSSQQQPSPRLDGFVKSGKDPAVEVRTCRFPHHIICSPSLKTGTASCCCRGWEARDKSHTHTVRKERYAREPIFLRQGRQHSPGGNTRTHTYPPCIHGTRPLHTIAVAVAVAIYRFPSIAVTTIATCQ